MVLKLRVFVTKQLLSSTDSPESLLSPTAQAIDSTQHTEHTPNPIQNTDNSSQGNMPYIEDNIPLKPCIDTEKEFLSITRQLCRVTMDILNGEDVDTDTRAGELMEEFPFTSSLYLFGVTALRNKQLWINTETFLILLLEMLGESSTRLVNSQTWYNADSCSFAINSNVKQRLFFFKLVSQPFF